MAIERRYTEPLQVVDTPEMVARITRISDRRKVSKALVVRELIAAGIDDAERAAGIAPDAPEALAHSG